MFLTAVAVSEMTFYLTLSKIQELMHTVVMIKKIGGGLQLGFVLVCFLLYHLTKILRQRRLMLLLAERPSILKKNYVSKSADKRSGEKTTYEKSNDSRCFSKYSTADKVCNQGTDAKQTSE